MIIPTAFLVAISLAMDAFAVSLACSLYLKNTPFRKAVRMPLSFGVFQAIMPIAGWHSGAAIRDTIAQWDHWIAFVLLAGVGGHMIFEAFSGRTHGKLRNPLIFSTLIVLSIATSIDAFAVGAGLSLVNMPVYGLAATAGIVTFALSVVALYIGSRTGHLFEKGAVLLGGVILIAIGARILIQHSG